MVIILQQTLENGQRFVSTVVEGAGGSVEETSFTSNFSLNSQHSISERSAIYKQRIDSLFGKQQCRITSPFRTNSVEPFSIRINGSPVEPFRAGGADCEVTARVITHTHQRLLVNGSEHEDDDDDTCSRITDKGSIITDSLTHKTTIKGSRLKGSSSANVSSVRITCEPESQSPQPHSIVIGSCSTTVEVPASRPLDTVSVDNRKEPLPRSSPGKPGNMWRNGNYGETPRNPDDKAFGIVRTSPGGILQFPVEYLGSVPVQGNTTSLQDLQIPLRNLYADFLTRKNVMSGQLAITSDGLRFEAPKIRLVNPFTTIAVWAAIKFVARGEPMPTDCAFMPLISDPEGQDKSRLFSKMDSELSTVYLTCLAESRKGFKNPPLFACVMREASFSLDCHAFACKCAEDAIVVAANLYQSLVDKMRSGNKEGESGYGSLNRTSPSATHSSPNQNRSSSSASSTGVEVISSNDAVARACNSSGSGASLANPLASGPSSSGGSGAETRKDHRVVFSDSESLVPIRPPRRKKKFNEIPCGNLKRYNSEDSILLKMPSRRRSFKGNYQSKVKKRVQISTPDETSSADSVNESIDQVLDRIVNPGGMSFNDLKPSYQELILKIALTLTQDQLYQKSKQAMKKHQQFHVRKKSKQNASSGEASDDNSQFLNHLLKSFSKIKSSKTSSPSKRSSGGKAAPLTGGPHHKPSPFPLPAPRKVILKKPKEEEPFMSFCSGCACEKCSEKCYCSLPSKHGNGKTNCSAILGSECNLLTPIVCSQNALDATSDKPKKVCGYDTDSCAESEKCYCSLQRVKSNGLKIYNINLDTETSDTDTNSYDLEPFNQPNENSSVAFNAKTLSSRSVEILSYHPSKRLSYCLSPVSPDGKPGLQTTNAMVHFEDACSSHLKNGPKLRPSCLKSQESCQESSIALQRDKVLLITGSSPSTRVVYKDSHNYNHGRLEFGDGKRSRTMMHRDRDLLDIMEDECNDEDNDHEGNEAEADDEDDGLAPEKVLSMKKTAEIAAMFTNLKLEQTTNVIPDLSSNNFESSPNTEDSAASLDFETSLGYLP